MDIKSSLAIEEKNTTTINLIFSGSFAKVYNQSFYLLTEVLGKKLKPSAKRIKSAGNRFVVSGGFPFHAIEVEYPDAKRCEWGYQLMGEFSTEGYVDWLSRHEAAAVAVVNVGTASSGSACPQECVQAEPRAENNKTTYKHSGHLNIAVSPQQAAYLLTWQKGNYPIEVDLGFIESLQKQFSNKATSSD